MKHIHRSLYPPPCSARLPPTGRRSRRCPRRRSITSAPYTISASGFYQLGADLTYAGNSNVTNDAIITINAPNVTLDFGGHYISGPSTNMATLLYGVYANDRANLTIQNGTVSHCLNGIELTSASGNSGGTTANINQQVRNLLVTHWVVLSSLLQAG